MKLSNTLTARGGSQKRSDIAFEEAFRNKVQHKVYNLDYFLDKCNYFNKSKEQVDAIYKAIKDPDEF